MAAVQNPALTALTTPIQTAALQVPVRAALLPALLPPPPPFLEVLGRRDVDKTSAEWVGVELLWDVSGCKYQPLSGFVFPLRSAMNACYVGVLGTLREERGIAEDPRFLGSGFTQGCLPLRSY